MPKNRLFRKKSAKTIAKTDYFKKYTKFLKQSFINLFGYFFLKSPFFLKSLFESTLDPLYYLHGIRALKERLRDAINDRQEARNRFYPTITWGIIIFVQITLIPDDPITQGEQERNIYFLTWITPLSSKFYEDNWVMWDVLLNQAFEKLLVREGCHLSWVGHSWIDNKLVKDLLSQSVRWYLLE